MPQLLPMSLVCTLLLAALASAQVHEDVCIWDSNTDPKQGLDPKSLENGARHLSHLTEVTTNEGCQKACCENVDCQIAMVGMPADGTAECFLVSCLIDGQDVCTLRSDSQFRVYRKDIQPKPSAESDKIEVVALDNADKTDKAGDNSTDRCSHPRVVGPCRAAFRKYYYDAANQSCKMFIYGGCGGNGNNFETQEECLTACGNVTATAEVAAPQEASATPAGRMVKPRLSQDQAPRDAPELKSVKAQPHHTGEEDEDEVVIEEAKPNDLVEIDEEEFHPDVPLQLKADQYEARCEAAPEVGPCRASMKRWHYDSKTGGCQTFIYGGCQSNLNNYVSEESCLAACAVTVIPKSRKFPVAHPEVEVTEEYREACMVQSDSGPCRAAFPMFYYQHSTGTCQSFIYGGCQGNNNAYATPEECMSRCGGGVQGHMSKSGVTRWTPAFFLVATLAVIAALLLTSLIILTLRRTRLHRNASPSDKEELLPEPYEEPSVDSLALEEPANAGRA